MKKLISRVMAGAFACAAAMTALSSCVEDNAKKIDEAAGAAELAELQKGWANPPQSARPQVWWHWMNGNITKDGITKDLEWMHRIGLGGAQTFDASGNSEVIVKDRLVYMHDGWKDAFAHAAKTADRLGLELSVASSPGWSTTGGPWVKPEDAMKKLVWRISEVKGGGKVSHKLPQPFTNTGAFQNGGPAGRGQANLRDQHYEDIAVIAVRQPDGRKSLAELGAKVSGANGEISLKTLTDDDVVNGVFIPIGEDETHGWIQYEFPEEVTVHSLTLSDGTTGGLGMSGNNGCYLEVSADGKEFTKVADISAGRVIQRTVSIPATTGKFFRLNIPKPRSRGMSFMGGPAAPAPKGVTVTEFALWPETKVNRFEDKAGFAALGNANALSTPGSDEAFAKPEDVVDVTGFVRNGKLTWDAPEGDWRIYRFGWSLTGKQNHPAPLEATGLEVDKLDPDAWTRFFRTYFDMYTDASDGMIGQRGVQYILTDSYEAEHLNWTPAMFEEFKTRRGYDLVNWMPVLAGEVIGSPVESDQFLWDWRMTIGEMLTHTYELLTEIAQNEYDMKGRYTEAHEAGRCYVVDGMDVKKGSQIPMSAMWTDASWLPRNEDGTPNRNVYNLDGRESSSVAHIYGQNVAAAESFTAPGQGGQAYSFHPGNLKATADLMLSNGTNRFIVHESAHQPSDEHVPGLSLGGIGQWFNRHETWAEQAKVWVDYLSRSCYMLMAGANVADVLIYYGEDNCIVGAYGNGAMPDFPEGYNYDFASPDVLLNMVEPVNGKLVGKFNNEYEVLWLDRNIDYMSVKMLRRLAEFAENGIIICGNRPVAKAGQDGTQEEWDALVAKIWDSGRKNVTTEIPVEDVLIAAGVTPDIKVDGTDSFRYLHRTLPNTEIYWINKPSMENETVEVSVRLSGLKPYIWDPVTGAVTEASYKVKGGRTVVTLNMVPDDAQFIVFTGTAGKSGVLKEKTAEEILEIGTPWTVEFEKGMGAPEGPSVFPTLKSYTDIDIFGIKYFSGTATYTNTFEIPAVDGNVVIDLGQVENMADVYVNGIYCGTAWKTPYKVDISGAVKEGVNELRLDVVNVWPNRLIGDLQPENPERLTYTDSRGAFTAESPLRPAGLLGPVRIMNIN